MNTDVSDNLKSEMAFSLLRAARDDELYDVDFLLDLRVVEVDARHEEFLGMTPLMVALYNGHIPLAYKFMDRGADVNARDVAGGTPLMYAAAIEDSLLTESIIKRGAYVNAVPTDRNSEKKTALMIALERRIAGVAWLLVKKGAYVDVTDVAGRNPLNICAHLSIYDSRFADLHDYMMEKGESKNVEA